jgi:hypothetical protein
MVYGLQPKGLSANPVRTLNYRSPGNSRIVFQGLRRNTRRQRNRPFGKPIQKPLRTSRTMAEKLAQTLGLCGGEDPARVCQSA